MARDESVPEGLISRTESFDVKTPITKIVPSVMDHDAVIINKDSDYFGIIDSRVIYRQLQNLNLATNQKAEKFAIRVPKISDTTHIDDVIYYFHKSRARALPYVKDGKVRGIMRRITLLKVLLSLGRLTGVTVQESMVAPLIGIDVSSTIAQAKTAMRENKMNRLAVLDGGKFAGIVTNYDLMDRAMSTRERLPERKSVSTFRAGNITLDNVLQRNPRKIEQSRGLADAVRVMLENNVSSLIVTKGDKPVGILTELDVIENVMARSGMKGDKVFISGLDSETYQYEDEIREELNAFSAKMEKLSGVRIEYITLQVKKFKTKSYELYARVSLGNQGIINMNVTGHIFERTLRELLAVVEKDIRRKKERWLGIRRVTNGAHPDDEVE